MMLTRCPGCTTIFRLTPEQIKARHGQVRCGRCQQVFDAIEFLVETPVTGALIEEAPATSIADVPLDVNIKPPADTEHAGIAPEEESVTPAAVATEVLATAEDDVRTATAKLASEVETTPASSLLLELPTQPSPLSAAYLRATEASRIPRWPWLIASILALVALIAQAALSFRADLVSKYPGSRPLLEHLCTHFDCTIGLPSNPQQVSIEASDLHPAKKGGLELTATLRNRAPHAQAWPQLELTLTDGADKPIVRKVIAPEQYLPATQSADDGFAANGEQAVQLLLDAGTLPAAGYRLYLFYP